MGAGLGLTTGWVVRAALASRGVKTIPGVTYRRVDDTGLHITVDGTDNVLEVDTIVVCVVSGTGPRAHGKRWRRRTCRSMS